MTHVFARFFVLLIKEICRYLITIRCRLTYSCIHVLIPIV